MLESIRNINGISKGELYDWNYFSVKTFSTTLRLLIENISCGKIEEVQNICVWEDSWLKETLEYFHSLGLKEDIY